MTTTLLNARLDSDVHGELVASFRDVRGAQLALEHLVDEGFPVDAVAVEPRDLRVRPEAVEGCEQGWRGRIAAAVGSATIAAAVVGFANDSVLYGVLSWIVAAPLTVAIVYAASRVMHRIRRRRSERCSQIVVAGRFDLVCSRRAGEANHILASWWNPQAQPSLSSHRAADES